MKLRSPAKAEPRISMVLIDGRIENQLSGTYQIERLKSFESTSRASFQMLQTRAWWMYLHAMTAKNLATAPCQPHASLEATVEWVNTRLESSDLDNARELSRTSATKYVPTKTLQCVEHAVPGSAEIYYWGPDFSLLWQALSGEDDDGRAIAWLQDLTGLTFSEISRCDSTFLEVLLDIHEPIALHATAAMIAMLPKQLAPTGARFPEDLLLLHPAAKFALKTTRRIEDEVNAALVLDNSWYKKAVACINHSATIRRLSLYGLARTDVLAVRGSPTLGPKANERFEHGVGRRQLVTQISFDRSAIPDPSRIPKASEGPDRYSLGEVARYWHRKIHGR